MRVLPITINEIPQWSKLWYEYWKGNGYLLRNHDEGYYVYKYLNNVYSTAFYCVNEQEDVIGFCGINSKEYRTGDAVYKIAEFSDFIFDEQYKMQGYVKEFLKLLFENELKDYCKFIFYPVDRNAFITWRFLLKIENTLEMSRWCVSLRDVNSSAVSLKYRFIGEEQEECSNFIRDNDYIHWRYFLHPEKHKFFLIKDQTIKGYLVYKEVTLGPSTGAEIGRLYLENDNETEELVDLLQEITGFIRLRGYDFFLLKVLNNSIYNQYFTNTNYSKVFEKKYGFIVKNQQTCCDINLSNIDITGEEADNPREAGYIKNFLG